MLLLTVLTFLGHRSGNLERLCCSTHHFSPVALISILSFMGLFNKRHWNREGARTHLKIIFIILLNKAEGTNFAMFYKWIAQAPTVFKIKLQNHTQKNINYKTSGVLQDGGCRLLVTSMNGDVFMFSIFLCHRVFTFIYAASPKARSRENAIALVALRMRPIAWISRHVKVKTQPTNTIQTKRLVENRK